MSIFTDTFTGTPAADLTTHTPTGGSGGPWTKHVDQNTGGLIRFDSAGTGLCAGAGTNLRAVYLPSTLTPSSADYEAVANMVCRSAIASGTSHFLGVRVGGSTGQLDGYYLRWVGSSLGDGGGTLELRLATTSLSTSLIGSWSAPSGTWTAGSTKTITLRAVGTALTVLVDGTSRIAVTNATVTRVGKPVLYNATSQPTTGSGWHWTSLTVNDLGASAPVNTVAPVVSGTARVGSTLSATTGTWTGSPTPTFTYQWQRDTGSGYTNISGATSSSCTLTSPDAGASIRCVVTGTNTAGNASANSNAVSVPGVPVNTVAPAITPSSGPYNTGDSVTCDGGTWTNSPTLTYQWYRGASPITGETAVSYTLVTTDEGANIFCRVTADNGSIATADSNIIVPAVASPLSDSSFLIYYSGGTGNTSPAASIGGARGGTFPDDDTNPNNLNMLFGPIAGSIASSGGTFYRVVYIRNTHASATAAGCVAYIQQQLAHAGLTVAVAVPTQDVNTDVPALASGTTAPTGVTWITTTNPSLGGSFGDLGPGQYRGLYVRLSVGAGTTAIAEDDFVLAVQGNAT
jgi:hypothetical protein